MLSFIFCTSDGVIFTHVERSKEAVSIVTCESLNSHTSVLLNPVPNNWDLRYYSYTFSIIFFKRTQTVFRLKIAN